MATSHTPRLGALALLLVLVALQWLLVSNPGFFSHDELQWGARADVPGLADIRWVAWTDVGNFQWRPLTFNLWQLLSHLLFGNPQAMHLAWVLMGSAVALMLGGLLMRLGADTWVARGAVLAFALGPYPAYVHGWVATLADLLWVAAGLGLAHVLVWLRWRGASPWLPGLAAFAFTAAALMAKEAALAIPALLGLAWVLRRNDPVGLAAVVGSGLAAVLYLGLRVGPIMAGGGDDTYAVMLHSAPRNWAAYWLLPLRPTAFEVQNVWYASSRFLWAGVVVWAVTIMLVLRTAPRAALAMVLGGTLALAPALPLGFAANQYGYGFWACVVGCLAAAWPELGRPTRLWIGFLAVMACASGFAIQKEMNRVGHLQAVFQPALAEALAGHDGELRIRKPEESWIYQRLSFNILSWRGRPIGDRIAWVEPGEPADYAVADDGRLVPLR